MNEEMYSTADAAKYLGVHINTLRKAIVAERLKPDNVFGKQEQLFFSQATLDDYAAKWRSNNDEFLSRREIGEMYHINPNMVWRALSKRKVVPDAYRGRTRVYGAGVAGWLAAVEGWRKGDEPLTPAP